MKQTEENGKYLTIAFALVSLVVLTSKPFSDGEIRVLPFRLFLRCPSVARKNDFKAGSNEANALLDQNIYSIMKNEFHFFRLTAYYQKVFCQLAKIPDVTLDKSIPCAAFAWLEAQQIQDGSFQELSGTSQYIAVGE